MSFLKFWNWQLGADRFVAKYEDGRFSTAQTFYCFLLVTCLTFIFSEIFYWMPRESGPNALAILSSASAVLMTLLGTFYLFHKHGKQAGFVEKYFVVAAATIPVVTVYLLVFIIVSGYFSLFLSDVVAQVAYLQLSSLVLLGLIYWKLGTYFSHPVPLDQSVER